jgi:hypothetical protein
MLRVVHEENAPVPEVVNDTKFKADIQPEESDQPYEKNISTMSIVDNQDTESMKDEEQSAIQHSSSTDSISEASTMSSQETLALQSANTLEDDSFSVPIPVCHRTMHTTVTVLQIINKIVKNKTLRIFSLVIWKTSALFKRILLMPYYKDLHSEIYKLMKHQLPYLGRKWKMANMKVVSGVYSECKMSLMDDYLLMVNVDGLTPPPNISKQTSGNTGGNSPKDGLEAFHFDMHRDDVKDNEEKLNELIDFWHKQIGFDINSRKFRFFTHIEHVEENWENYQEILDKEGFWFEDI